MKPKLMDGKAINKNSKILLTGANGFLGHYVKKELIKSGYNPRHIFTPSSQELDLRISDNCGIAVKNIDIVIHLAAKVGGIGLNQEIPATLFYDNLIMGVQLMEKARQAHVKKFVTVGTVCSYPKYTPIPFKEANLWLGYPEETNAPYALAKKALLVQSQAYRQQYNFNAIYPILTNLYGPGDNFDPKSSHVIPALISKSVEAKKKNLPSISLWGDGSASREFLYVEDAARAIVMATEKYNQSQPINIGSGQETSINQLAILINEIVGYKGKILWDTNKPNGQPKRCLDITRAQKEFAFTAKVKLYTGLKKTIDWYLSNIK